MVFWIDASIPISGTNQGSCQGHGARSAEASLVKDRVTLGEFLAGEGPLGRPSSASVKGAPCSLLCPWRMFPPLTSPREPRDPGDPVGIYCLKKRDRSPASRQQPPPGIILWGPERSLLSPGGEADLKRLERVWQGRNICPVTFWIFYGQATNPECLPKGKNKMWLPINNNYI